MAKRRGRRPTQKKQTHTPTPPPPEDIGTPELQEKRKRGMLMNPLDYYHLTQKSIGERQHIAGMRLFSDFHTSGIYPSSSPTTALVCIVPRSSGDSDFSTRQLEARERMRRAINSISGNSQQVVALNVCCYGFYVADLQLKYYVSSQQRMALLKEALDSLANFYGLPED